MNSTNPVFRKLQKDGQYTSSYQGNVMTINGTINKIGILLLLTSATALYTWSKGIYQSRTLMFMGVVGTATLNQTARWCSSIY